MGAEPLPSPTGKPGGSGADLHIETTCQACGAKITKVRNLRRPAEWVELDGKDPAGDWWAVRDTVTRHWRVTQPERGEDPPESGIRYRRHRCREAAATAVMAAALTARVVAESSATANNPYLGPCAGSCGAMTRAYGPGAQLLCDDCREVLERWRAKRGPHRGSIPYGKLIDGVYHHPTPHRPSNA